MTNETRGFEEYRKSHASPDYGNVYEKTYLDGYYRHQWELIERPLLRSILNDLRESGKTDCLDFACGTGRITQLIEEMFPTVTGVDISATMLDQARLKCNKARFIERDITASPLEQEFDVVTAFRFFLNAEPELRRSALRAISDVLRDDGRLVLNIHVNSSSVLGLAYRIRNALKRETVAKTCSLKEITNYLDQAGFEVEDTFWYSFLPRVGWRFPRLSRRLMLPSERLFNRLPSGMRVFAQSFVIVARKVESR